MKEIDSFLEILFSRIYKRFADFSYIIMSDHGFCPVQAMFIIET
jgi:hypothetical protein